MQPTRDDVDDGGGRVPRQGTRRRGQERANTTVRLIRRRVKPRERCGCDGVLAQYKAFAQRRGLPVTEPNLALLHAAGNCTLVSHPACPWLLAEDERTRREHPELWPPFDVDTASDD
jgi:hypothetical protein